MTAPDSRPRWTNALAARLLAAHREGPMAAQREAVRRLLLQTMGFHPERVPIGVVPKSGGKAPKDGDDGCLVAHDGLLEIGYPAAADVLLPNEERPTSARRRARDALSLLEAGPPSVRLAGYAVYEGSIWRTRIERWSQPEVAIARLALTKEYPWIRFHLRSGPWKKDKDCYEPNARFSSLREAELQTLDPEDARVRAARRRGSARSL